jgi:hypothetical protein
MSKYKKTECTALIGLTIQSVDFSKDHLSMVLSDGRNISVDLDDDGCGGNDSHAYFGKIDIEDIIGEKILSADEHDFDSCGGTIILKTARNTATIEIIHDHNGYYGFAYDISGLE